MVVQTTVEENFGRMLATQSMECFAPCLTVDVRPSPSVQMTTAPYLTQLLVHVVRLDIVTTRLVFFVLLDKITVAKNVPRAPGAV